MIRIRHTAEHFEFYVERRETEARRMSNGLMVYFAGKWYRDEPSRVVGCRVSYDSRIIENNLDASPRLRDAVLDDKVPLAYLLADEFRRMDWKQWDIGAANEVRALHGLAQEHKILLPIKPRVGLLANLLQWV